MHPNFNTKVSTFLLSLKHPKQEEIDVLRACILGAHENITENIKWNSPNYCFQNEDRITLRIQPISLKAIQVIFHCGAKTKQELSRKILQNDYPILEWKSNDRAVASFLNLEEITKHKEMLCEIVNEWLHETK
jgi:hypothetical protein